MFTPQLDVADINRKRASRISRRHTNIIKSGNGQHLSTSKFTTFMARKHHESVVHAAALQKSDKMKDMATRNLRRAMLYFQLKQSKKMLQI